MKKRFKNGGLLLPVMLLLNLFSCKVDTLESISELEQKVSLVQVEGGNAT